MRSLTASHKSAWAKYCIGIGGDPVVGLNYIKVLEMFRMMPKRTVSSSSVKSAAMRKRWRPINKRNQISQAVVAYIAGRQAPWKKMAMPSYYHGDSDRLQVK